MDDGPNHGSISQESGVGRTKNRLAVEKSPYLLQHADNPVDWYPWSEEAFTRASNEDKPIFLSIGYSSCHWCHVMEEECFEDKEVALLLNRHFISIKVDREERPDIDHVYMMACQAMIGSGGWPLTIIMTPDKKPFLAGTYIPKHAVFSRPGLMEILPRVAELWRSNRGQLLEIGERIVGHLSHVRFQPGDGRLGERTLEQAYQRLRESFDESFGGFETAPKFPMPHRLSLLLRRWKRSGDGEALRMVEKTLDAMWRGGIFDHLGFGFHRYSTDGKWLVPHFEKMLYDQALLAISYIEAYQATRKERYALVARQVFTYVLNRMTAPEGGFYAAEDADSEGEEGKFYTWTKNEIEWILGESRGDLLGTFFGVTEEGNFEKGFNVLHVEKTANDFADETGVATNEFERVLEEGMRHLFAHREKRVHPFKDDKILTDWNGLMIAALAKSAHVLDRQEYSDAASKAADFILERLRLENGRLLHRFRGGEAGIPAYLNDYAFFVWGLIELYEATFQIKYLKGALELTDRMVELFWDEGEGGFFLTGKDVEQVITRVKEFYDGAVPSGNSVAALCLLRLGRITMRRDLEAKAEKLLEFVAGILSHAPTGFTQLLIALDFAIGPGKEIVIVGDLDSDETKEMLHAVRKKFIPGKVLILIPDARSRCELEEISPFLGNMSMIDGNVTAYVCENYSCKLPVTEIEKLIPLLE